MRFGVIASHPPTPRRGGVSGFGSAGFAKGRLAYHGIVSGEGSETGHAVASREGDRGPGSLPDGTETRPY